MWHHVKIRCAHVLHLIMSCHDGALSMPWIGKKIFFFWVCVCVWGGESFLEPISLPYSFWQNTWASPALSALLANRGCLPVGKAKHLIFSMPWQKDIRDRHQYGFATENLWLYSPEAFILGHTISYHSGTNFIISGVSSAPLKISLFLHIGYCGL